MATGSVDRVRRMAPSGVAAAADMFGTETAQVAIALNVPAARISMIAGQLPGVTTVAGFQAVAGTLERIAALLCAGQAQGPDRGDVSGRADSRGGDTAGQSPRQRKGRRHALKGSLSPGRGLVPARVTMGCSRIDEMAHATLQVGSEPSIAGVGSHGKARRG